MSKPRSHVKIVCTLGPSSSEKEVMERMIKAGMGVARMNMSHGTHEDHEKVINDFRAVCKKNGRFLGVMMDLQGPKIRVGLFEKGEVILSDGANFTITGRDVTGTETIVSTTYPALSEDVKPGDILLLDDGLLSLKVKSTDGKDVHTEVLVGGVLKNKKGINVPGAGLSVDAITPKDLEDLDFGIKQGVDFIAMSFVRHADDVKEMRACLKERGVDLPIISKIEKPQALEHMDAIIAESDAIMVARGDLGVEIPPELVPGIQKTIIQKCNLAGKPVITATQMLESMIHNPRATRAEASDVANAVLDGSDAVMLSGESASGKYPAEAVEVMCRIVAATEAERLIPPEFHTPRKGDEPMPVNEGVALSACALARLVSATAIASITMSGSMAQAISHFRPGVPIYAISQHEHVLRGLSLHWGIQGILMDDLSTGNIDEALEEVEQHLLSEGKMEKGQKLVLTAGLPFSARKATNMVRVDEIR